MSSVLIGDILKVRWHYMCRRFANGVTGYVRESYVPKEMYNCDKDSAKLDLDLEINLEIDLDIDDTMDENKNYAYVYLKYGKIYVRNLFNSKDEKGFNQKNTYFEDKCSGMFCLEDTNNLLLEYIKKGYKKTEDLFEEHMENHYCVEYCMKEGVNIWILEYIANLQLKCDNLEARLKKLEEYNNKKNWFYGNLKM